MRSAYNQRYIQRARDEPTNKSPKRADGLTNSRADSTEDAGFVSCNFFPGADVGDDGNSTPKSSCIFATASTIPAWMPVKSANCGRNQRSEFATGRSMHTYLADHLSRNFMKTVLGRLSVFSPGSDQYLHKRQIPRHFDAMFLLELRIGIHLPHQLCCESDQKGLRSLAGA